jgi:hypothetical protein
MSNKVLVTHHAPDLDAIGAVWVLKRFDSQHYATAKIAFVNPGERITLREAEELGCQLHEATHVDTGLGRFDHHQPERGEQYLSIHPELKENQALSEIARFITEIDHFGEVYWPEPESTRYNFMIHELIKGAEYLELHTDDSQMHFGMQCLDHAYAVLVQYLKASEIVAQRGEEFTMPFGKCLSLETRNDDTIKLAQKIGFLLVVRKDPEHGHIRIKARPDSAIELKQLYEEIKKRDNIGTWYYHPSGKMLINGSHKHRNQKPSPLSLAEVVELIKKVYTA